MQKSTPTTHRRPNGLRTWLEVDSSALQANLQTIKAYMGDGPQIWAVAKSNAYGHSLVDYALTMDRAGMSGICVDSIVEATALRRAGIQKQILVLGTTLPERLAEAADINIAVTISCLEAVNELKSGPNKTGPTKPLAVHIKIDSGMHRQGFCDVKNLNDALTILKNRTGTVRIDGLYTHFAAAKNPAFPGDTERQLASFLAITRILKNAGFNPLLHAAATSSALLFPSTRLDMVRIGIGLYGLWPSAQTKAALQNKLTLDPALSWHTIIAEIKKVKKNEQVGYDFTERLSRDSRVAVLPVGYWHGYPRALSSIGHVLIKGKRARVLGRVSMDMTTVDVTDIRSVARGDIVTLLGTSGQASVSADELADLAGTINYEIVTRINPLIKRLYIN